MGARQSSTTTDRYSGSYAGDLEGYSYNLPKRPSMPTDLQYSGAVYMSHPNKRRAFSESDSVILADRQRPFIKESRKKKAGCDEILSWKDSFGTLLSHPVGYELFYQFLLRERSEESLLFWRACEEFKRSSFRITAKAKRLYRTYVQIDSTHQVNLDYRERRKIEEALKTPNKTIFDEAQRKVRFMMMSDPYPRFLRSDIYLGLESKSLQD